MAKYLRCQLFCRCLTFLRTCLIKIASELFVWFLDKRLISFLLREMRTVRRWRTDCSSWQRQIAEAVVFANEVLTATATDLCQVTTVPCSDFDKCPIQ